MGEVSLLELFSPPNDPSLLGNGVYDPWLVALSLLVAIFSSWMGLQMAGQAAATKARSLRNTALLTGSLALGSGVWAMHFIGMLAFDLCTPVTYDQAVTIGSMLPSIAASFVAMTLIGRPHISGWQLISGGVLVGAGIGAMHYSGMAAMQSALAQRYDPWMFALSIVVAVVLATLALWIRFGLHSLAKSLSKNWRLFIGAVVMGCAIASMHYTGMAAARFVGTVPEGSGGTSNATFLALAISLITVAFTGFVMAANGLLRYLEMYRQQSHSESWLRTLLATAVDGVITLDADGQILEFNAAAERIFGWTTSEILGRNFSELVETTHHAGLRADLGKRQKDVIGTGDEMMGVRKDGSRVPIRRALGHARLADKDLFVCFVTDISEHRQREEDLRLAKERAEQAAAARAAFLANMSHEIRTPMNSILGFTDVLLHDELSPEQRRHLEIVRNAGRSLLRLLNGVLDTAKLDKGAVELELTDFDLLALIDELSSTLGSEARRKRLTLDIHFGSGVPRCIHGDELRIRQVLTNLLANAIKFTEQGKVDLIVDVQPGALLFCVRDTGMGIAPDRLSSIFEPFTQADASMSRRFGGTGLGTTISKQLVELMGGRIWAESTLGQGSAFYVLLPFVAARGAIAQTERMTHVPILPPLTILCVDDVAQNLELLSLLLSKQGHAVVSATNGGRALELVGQRHFDLVLMDVQMPEMDGLETTRRLRAAEAKSTARRTPVIAMTASVLNTDRQAARAADMDGFASKPVEPAALIVEIARVLGFLRTAATAREPSTRPVLDHIQGLQRWADNAAAYQQALQHLLVDCATVPKQLQQLAASEDLDSMRGLAHKTRGLAANLGAAQLTAALGELERASNADAAQTILSRLAQDFSAATAAIEGFLARQKLVVTESPTLAPEAAVAMGTQLLAALRRGAIDEASLAEFSTALSGCVPGDRLTQLRRAIDEFDFDVAQIRLIELLDFVADKREAAA